ncbi:MAG: DUF3515 domain-containing protein [Nocardioides sp.]
MSLRTRGVVACAVVLLAGGCSSGPPEIDTSELSAADARTCRGFVASLPDTLAGEESVEVAGDDEYGAAWGDPAIVLTCGAAIPEEFDELSSCVEASGVGWFVPEAEQDDQSSDVTWTAVGHRPVVRVDVPDDYRPEGAAAVLAELAEPVGEHLDLVQPCR